MNAPHPNKTDTGTPGQAYDQQRSHRVYAVAFRGRRGFGGDTVFPCQTAAHATGYIVRRVCGVAFGTEDCGRHDLGRRNSRIHGLGNQLGYVLHNDGKVSRVRGANALHIPTDYRDGSTRIGSDARGRAHHHKYTGRKARNGISIRIYGGYYSLFQEQCKLRSTTVATYMQWDTRDLSILMDLRDMFRACAVAFRGRRGFSVRHVKGAKLRLQGRSLAICRGSPVKS